MLKSMTGFGRCETVSHECKISVEIKSVNHRYLDLNMKMPRKFNAFEAAIRNLLKNYINRGKVDIFINYENYNENKVTLKYNEALAREYVDCFQLMQTKFGIENDMKTSILSRCSEVLSMEQITEEEDELWGKLASVLEQAATHFVESRMAEGTNLESDLFYKLEEMIELTNFIEERSPVIIAEYRHKLENKVKELLENTTIDENRILTEVTLFADKICVDEEVVRLKSHIENMKQSLLNGGSIGRQLDFVAQEMNREANTVLSKSSDMQVSERAIVLKNCIEKVREQIQNIE